MSTTTNSIECMSISEGADPRGLGEGCVSKAHAAQVGGQSLSAAAMCFASLSVGLINNRTKGLAHAAGYSPSVRNI